MPLTRFHAVISAYIQYPVLTCMQLAVCANKPVGLSSVHSQLVSLPLPLGIDIMGDCRTIKGLAEVLHNSKGWGRLFLVGHSMHHW